MASGGRLQRPTVTDRRYSWVLPIEICPEGSATVPVAPSGVPPDGIADGNGGTLRKESGATPDTAGGTPALPFQLSLWNETNPC
jgi:hypothetical protein